MKRFRLVVLIIIGVLLLVGIRYLWPTTPVEVNNFSSVQQEFVIDDNKDLTKNTKAAILINMDTNQILYEKSINTPLPVYSVSKLMFLASVSKEMKKEKISYDTKITMDSDVNKVNKNSAFSTANLKEGQVYTIKELFEGSMIPSGNDATIELANFIFGSHQKAVMAMNNNARQWGMNHASFITVSGLDGEYLNKVGIASKEGKNLMSVTDTIILLQRIMSYYPEIIKAGSLSKVEIGQNNLIETTNQLMTSLHKYDGVYGLKTGSNNEDYSYNIVSLYKDRHNQNLAAVAFNSRTTNSLYSDVKGLFNHAKKYKLTNIKDDLNLNAKFIYAKINPVLVLDQDYYLYHTNNTGFEYELTNYSGAYNEHLNAFTYGPKGTIVGKLSMANNANFFQNRPRNIGNVIIGEYVPQVSIVQKFGDFIVSLIKK